MAGTDNMWDAPYMADDPAPTLLQERVRQAVRESGKARDFFDKRIQSATGKSGKPIYDIDRGKNRNPSAESLKLIAWALDRPLSFFTDLHPTPAPSPMPETNAVVVPMEGASERRMVRDLPVWGTGLGAAMIIDGEAVEQTTLNTGEINRYAKRPVMLDGDASAYGLNVQGSSMYPVHPEGSLILASTKRTPRVGDDVVVYLRPKNEDDDGQRARCVLVKRLVRRSAQYIELEQFLPAITFRIPAEDVLRVDRVFTLQDLID